MPDWAFLDVGFPIRYLWNIVWLRWHRKERRAVEVEYLLTHEYDSRLYGDGADLQWDGMIIKEIPEIPVMKGVNK